MAKVYTLKIIKIYTLQDKNRICPFKSPWNDGKCCFSTSTDLKKTYFLTL